jgi:DnaJ domain
MNQSVWETQYFYARVNDAYSAFRRQCWDEARSIFLEVLPRSPNNPSYLTALAEIEFQLGNYQESIEYRTKGMEYYKEVPKSGYRSLIKAYMARLSQIKDIDRELAVRLCRTIAANYAAHLNQKELKVIEAILATSRLAADQETLRVAESAVNSPVPFAVTSGHAQIDVFETIQTHHKAKHCVLLPEGQLAWTAKWARPPYMQVRDAKRVQWEVKNIGYPKNLLALTNSICLITIDWKRNQVIIRSWSLDGKALAELSFSGNKVIAEVNRRNDKALVHIADRDPEGSENVVVLLNDSDQTTSYRHWIEPEEWLYIKVMGKTGWIAATASDVTVINEFGQSETKWHPPKIVHRHKAGVSALFGFANRFEAIDGKTHFGFHTEFALLGIEPTDDKDAIRRAYRVKALEWHPDRNSAPNATDTMQRINNAFRLLMSVQLKEQQIGAERWYEITSDDLISGLATGIDANSAWIACSSGNLYLYQSGSISKVRQVLRHWQVLGCLGADPLIHTPEGRTFVSTPITQQSLVMPRFDPWAAKLIPLKNHKHVAILSAKSQYFYVVEVGSLDVTEIKCSSIVNDLAYSSEHDYLAISCDKIYKARIDFPSQAHESQILQTERH